MELTGENLSGWIGSQGRVRRAKGLAEKLVAAAEGFVSLGVFERAMIVLYNDTLLGPCVGAAGLTRDELGHISDRSMESRFYERFTRKSNRLTEDGLFLVRHDAYPPGQMDLMIPSRRAPGEFTSWHPDNMFLAPFETFGNPEVGNLTADDPASGRVPEGDELRLLRVYLNELNGILEQATEERTDDFTGLANELWVQEVLEREEDRDEPFSVFYGRLQDMDPRTLRLGRAYQDGLVKAAAEIVRAATPEGAGSARIHGAEFVITMRTGDPGWIEGVENTVKRRAQRWNEKDRPALVKRLGLIETLLHDPASMLQFRSGVAVRREGEKAHEVLRRAETVSRNIFGPAYFGQE